MTNGSTSPIPTRDDELPANLKGWLNLFRGPWLSSATGAGKNSVPHVRSADGTHGTLQKALSMAATASGHTYRRYLTADRTFKELSSVDMPTPHEINESRAHIPKDQEGAPEHDVDPATLIQRVLEDEATAMEVLLDGDDGTVASDVATTEDYFPEAAGRAGLDDIPTHTSTIAKKQRRMMRESLRGLGGGNHGLDPRISNLVFADLNTDTNILPLVDGTIKSHIAVLATEDFQTLSMMGFDLPVTVDGKVQNDFKIPVYGYEGDWGGYDTGSPTDWRTEQQTQADFPVSPVSKPSDDPYYWINVASLPDNDTDSYFGDPSDDGPVFTDDAHLDNVGTDGYTMDGSNKAFANYVPYANWFFQNTRLYAEYRGRHGSSGSSPWWEYVVPIWGPGQDDPIRFAYAEEDDDRWVKSHLYTEIGQRSAAFFRLKAMHDMQRKWNRESAPTVQSSLLHHLLRFGTMREYVTAGGREYLYWVHSRLKPRSSLDDIGVMPRDDEGSEHTDTQDMYNIGEPETGADLLIDRAGYNSLWQKRTDRGMGGGIGTFFPRDLGTWTDRQDHLHHWNESAPNAEDHVIKGKDPRQDQHEDSLRHLQTVDVDDLRWQLTSTLDLSSHRLDAWWTSLATRGLAQHRGAEGNWETPTDPDYANWPDEDVFVPAGTRHKTLSPNSLPDDGDDDEDDDQDSGDSDARDRRDARETREEIEEAEAVRNSDIPGVAGSSPSYETGSSPNYETGSTTETIAYSDDDGSGVVLDESYLADDTTVSADDGLYATDATSKTAVADIEARIDAEITVPETLSVPPTLERGNDSGIYVGAWGVVENLEPDPESGDPGEYIQAPSLQQATTAAVLRGGNQAYEAGDEGHLSAVDLSPERVRTAMELLDGVRDGQPLKALLGYRFERALQEAGLQQHVLAFREAFPAFPDNRNQDVSTPKLGAKFDVVDGYALYGHLTYTTGGSGVTTDADYPSGLPAPGHSQDMHDALLALQDAVDALRDLLVAESVHQFAQGNFGRAKISLDTVAADGIAPEIDVIDTPRTETSITHRLSVTFGDARANSPSAAHDGTDWLFDTYLDHPTVKAVGSGGQNPEAPRVDKPDSTLFPDGHPLQVRADAEPNLDGWVADLLPAAKDIGCTAEYEWTESREHASGSFETPERPGRETVTDVGFRPDLVILTASAAVGEIGAGSGGDGSGSGDSSGSNGGSGSSEGSGSDDEKRTVYGWTHGVARRTHGGPPQQFATSVGYDTGVAEATTAVDGDRALSVVQQGSASGGSNPTARVTGEVIEFTSDGFEIDVGLTAGSTARPVAVEYLAIKTGDLSAIDVGLIDSPTSTGIHPEGLDVEADHVSLFAVDGVAAPGSGSTDASATTSGSVGIARGEAVATGSGRSQHGVSVSQGPGPNATPSIEAGAGSAIDLNGLSASVASLGSTMEIDVTSTDGTAHPIGYVAIESHDGAPTPELGVATAGENTLSGSFRPGAIEFVAVPGIPESDYTSGSGSFSPSGTGAAAGIGHGVVADPSAGRALAHSAGAGSVAGSGDKGGAVSLSWTNGGSTTEVSARVSGVSADGFTLEFPGNAPQDALILYRALPAAPAEIEHAPGTSLSMNELRVTPLDVLYTASTERDGALTQLERRIGYYLRRARKDKIPGTPGVDRAPIPDDATIDLALRESGGAAVSAGDMLEVIRSVRDLVSEGRALEADDLVHPAEAGEPGYDESTFNAVKTRANDLQIAATDLTEVIENRVAALDVDADEKNEAEPPSLTEQVDRIHEAIADFRSAVPLPGVKSALEGLVAAQNAESDVLETDLAAAARAMPAGPTTAADTDEAIQVEALGSQRIEGRADGSAGLSLRMEISGTSQADVVGPDGASTPLERQVDPVTMVDDGQFSFEADFHDVAPGTTFSLVALNGNNVVFSSDGRVLAPTGIGAEPVADATVSGAADVGSTTTITVQVTDDLHQGSGLTSVSDSDTVDTDSVGNFTATVDLSGADPGTPLSIQATDGNGNEVFATDGYVRRPATERDLAAAIADGEALPRLLWLDRARPDLDPHRSGSPAKRLHDRLDTAQTDWDAIDREVDLVKRWKGTRTTGSAQGRARPIAADIDGDDTTELGTLTDLKDPANHDLADLLRAIERALGLPAASGLTEAVDLTRGREHPEKTRFWAGRDDETLARTRASLSQLLRNPEGQTYRPETGFSPEFVAFLFGGQSGITGQLADRLFPYVEAFISNGGRLVAGLENDVGRADKAITGLRDAVYYPDRFADSSRGVSVSTLSTTITEITDYYAGPGLPALDAVDTWAERARHAALRRGASQSDVVQLDNLLARIASMRDHYTENKLREHLRDIEGIVSYWDSISVSSLVPAETDRMQRATAELRQQLEQLETWEDVAALDEVVGDVGSPPYHQADGTPQGGRPATEFVYVLDQLNGALSRYHSWLTDSSPPAPIYQPAQTRSTYQSNRDSWFGSFSSEASTVQTYVDVDRSTQLNEVFRRCVLETLRIPLLRAAYFGVYGATPGSAAGGTLAAEDQLLGQAIGVAERLRERIDRAADARSAARTHAGNGAYDEAAEREIERLEALFDDEFTVLPPMTLPNQREVSRTFRKDHYDELLYEADPMAVETWLQRQSRVRSRPAGLRETLTYGELLTDQILRSDLRAGQLPYRETDDWAGIDATDRQVPVPEKGTVSMVTYFASTFSDGTPIAETWADADPTDDQSTGAPVAGLYVDDWREAIPATEETTGIAVNYDDPGMEPPQSILLAVPPDETERDEEATAEAPWTAETVIRTVLETTDLMKMRGVDLDAIGKPADPDAGRAERALGHLFPGLLFPHNTKHRPDVPSVKFDRDRPMMEYYRNLRRNGGGNGANGGDDGTTDGGGGDD